MAVRDLWHLSDRRPCSMCKARTAGTPSKRHGVGRRWRVEVGDHPRRSFAVKADAEVWETQLRRVSPSRETVSGLLDRWLAAKADLEPSSITRAKQAAEVARARWGAVRPGEVLKADVRAWVAGMQSQRGPKAARVMGPASHSTKIKALQALAGALDIAVDEDVLVGNPARGIRVARDDRPEQLELDVATLQKLAARCGRHKPEYEALVWLLATAGPRPGECARFDVGDVSLERGRIRARKTKARRGRDIPVPASVLAILPLEGRAADEPLFTSPAGARINMNNFLRRVLHEEARALDLGLDGLVTHGLRHAAASLMIDAGAGVKTVQAALGHADGSTTLDVYAAGFDRRLDDVSRRMDRVIAAKVPKRADGGR